MRQNSVQKDVLEGLVIGKKGRGRPRMQWSHKTGSRRDFQNAKGQCRIERDSKP